MGGYVGYESRYGEGSLFWAVLPCNAEVQPFEKQLDSLTETPDIRKFDPEIPIVALTAHAFDTDQLAALEAGCNEYLLKPIDKTKLMAVLRKYCHKP